MLGLDSWLKRFVYFLQKSFESFESPNSRLDPPLVQLRIHHHHFGRRQLQRKRKREKEREKEKEKEREGERKRETLLRLSERESTFVESCQGCHGWNRLSL
jgi:hypothetical protein